MSVNGHLNELNEKHRMLERKIFDESTRPAADPVKIANWKHEKLKIKDAMMKLAKRVSH